MSGITNNFLIWKQPTNKLKICPIEVNTTGGETPTAEKFAKSIQLKKTYDSNKPVEIPEGAHTISIRPYGYTSDNKESSFEIDGVRYGIYDENNGEVQINHTTCEQEFVPAKTITNVIGKYRIRLVYPKPKLPTDVTEAQLNALFN